MKRIIVAALICVTLLGCHMNCVNGIKHDNKVQRTEKIEKVLSVNENTELVLKNINGGIQFSTWDKDSIKIEALIKDYNTSNSLKQITLEIKESANLISAIVENEEDVDGIEVVFKITASKNLKAKTVSSVNGDISISNISGAEDISTINGDISLKNIINTGEVSTVNGDIVLEKTDGKTTLETVNGDIKFNDCNLTKISTVNGDIYGKLSSNSAKLETSTLNGDIEIYYPKDYNNKIDAESLFGDIDLIEEEE